MIRFYVISYAFSIFFSCLYDVVRVVSAFLFNIFDGVTCSALLDLLLFHKIPCRAVSIEKDKHMAPAHSLKTTRSSHRAQYRRHQTVMPCQKSFPPPWTIPHWNSLSPSVVNTQSTKEFRHPLFKQIFSQKLLFFLFFLSKFQN